MADGGSRAGSGLTDSSRVAFITCVNDNEWYEECLLYLRHLRLPDGMSAQYIGIRGAKSMASGYNEAMMKSHAKYKVYLHQDTFIVNRDFVADALKLFSQKDIGVIGVIGCRSLPESGIWWDGMRCYGRVLHACEPESVVDSELMEPEGDFVDAETVDGLLIATQYDIPWREDLFTGWHMYDASECREFIRNGYKVAIPNQSAGFWCIHCPKEKPLPSEYKEYQRIFLEEYGKELSPEI